MAMELSAPWYILYKEMDAMFKKDKDVRVLFDPDEMIIKVFAASMNKAEALDKILINRHRFGNVTVNVIVVPPNSDEETDDIGDELLYAYAFDGNDALSFIRQVDTPYGVFQYVVFEPTVVQYFADDIGDVYGNCSTLYQNIAQEIFKGDGVYFCTDAVNGVKKEISEWP